MKINGPNFFIVGAPKCGTTALYSYLKKHPDVFFPENAKEPHHYHSDMSGFRWYTEKPSYLALFASEQAQEAKIRGDASVQYLYSRTAAEGIDADAPEARILVCLRDVVPFIRSYHNQTITNLDEDIVDLRKAWRASGRLRTVAREPSMLDYKSIGLFAEQIDRYRAVFPSDQIRILKLEEFTADPRGTYLALLDWLEVKDDGRNTFERVHAAKTQRSRAFARFLKSPPTWVRTGAGALKRLAGVRTLGLAKRLKQFNAAQSYGTAKMDAELAREIREHYAWDQANLTRHADLFLNGKRT